MKLRFEVDQAECFRRGIDCPKSIVTVEVDPKDLPQDQRNMIADRLSGIDVCQLSEVGRKVSCEGKPVHVLATEPTFAGLLEAIKKDQTNVEQIRGVVHSALKASMKKAPSPNALNKDELMQTVEAFRK